MKRVVAEMGGKNAIVVDADADLDDAVPAIVQSAFGYAGQKCSAASRLVVVDDIFDALAERLVGAIELVPIGHPRDPATVVGPLIDADAFERVRALPGLARRPRVACSCSAPTFPKRGWYAGPTLVELDDAQSRVATDEIFGPVLALLRGRDFDHAARDRQRHRLRAHGRAASPARRPTSARAGAELRAGNVYLNRAITGAVVGRQPFGGFGLSGVGSKAGGPDYLLQFVEPRVDHREHAAPRLRPGVAACNRHHGARHVTP